MTVDTPQFLARYNSQANAAMNQVLASLTPQEWEAPRGGYFPSFRALTGHLYTADIQWLVRFSALRPFKTVKGDPFDFPPSWDKQPFGGVDEYLSLRVPLDAALIAFTGELTDEDLRSDLEYRSSSGKAYTKNFGGLVLHLFNHQTHHRGAIALYLDQLGKANDFSNISAVL